MSNLTGARVLTAMGNLVLAFLLAGQAVAGFIAMPLKAELDLAQTVVVGKITEIAKGKEEPNATLVWGRARVAVSEVLKGDKTDEIKMAVAIHVNFNGMQSPPHVYSKGDQGIWIVMPDGTPSHGYGRLDMGRLNEVKATLAELDKRVWSKEVGGLQVWAQATRCEFYPRDTQQIIFAVKNVSKTTIWVPRSWHAVTAMARDSAGNELDLLGREKRSDTDPVVCQSLAPGVTRYMHPAEDYGAIEIRKDLAPGKYTVTVKLANDRGDGQSVAVKPKPVDAWKGKVNAPPFEIDIPKPPASKPAGG